ncbi:unnamed protein product [Phytophthora fragariaefolia]|uniref:Unnamed protein product n=1 Tax=Phytophthora fragariaefolia TaxID=1490495 RepID=A0A9W6Y8P5_9STRA|nr:unnamed protein product [Phytophthora fragariaefolia]
MTSTDLLICATHTFVSLNPRCVCHTRVTPLHNTRLDSTIGATYDEEETLAPLLAKVRAAAKSSSDEPVMVTEVSICDKTFPALIDTGFSRSAIEQSVVEPVPGQLVLRNEEATFKQADKSPGKTTHVATTPLNLLVFSSTRVCTHEL